MKIVGNMVGCYSSLGKSIIIEDGSGNEFIGFITDKEILLTATADDIKIGKTAGTENGIITGTHEC